MTLEIMYRSKSARGEQNNSDNLAGISARNVRIILIPAWSVGQHGHICHSVCNAFILMLCHIGVEICNSLLFDLNAWTPLNASYLVTMDTCYHHASSAIFSIFPSLFSPVSPIILNRSILTLSPLPSPSTTKITREETF